MSNHLMRCPLPLYGGILSQIATTWSEESKRDPDVPARYTRQPALYALLMNDPPADRSKLARKVGSTGDMEKRMKFYSLEKQLKIKTVYTSYFLSRRVDVQGCELFRDSISSLTEVNDPNVISPLFREVLDLVLNHGGYRFVKTQFFRLLLEMGAQSLAGLTPDAECLGFDNNNEFEQMVKWTEEYIGKLLPHFNAYKQYPQSEVTLKLFGYWHPHPAAFPNERKPVTFHVKDYVWSGIDFEDMFVDVCKAASPNDPYNTDWTTKEISDAKDHFFGMVRLKLSLYACVI
jgi:hypothetical protein